MKHAAPKQPSSSAAKSHVTRVVATIALATAATAMASPAMASDHSYGGGAGGNGGGHGNGGQGWGGNGGRYEAGGWEYTMPTPPSFQPPAGGGWNGPCGDAKSPVMAAVTSPTKEAAAAWTPPPAPAAPSTAAPVAQPVAQPGAAAPAAAEPAAAEPAAAEPAVAAVPAQAAPATTTAADAPAVSSPAKQVVVEAEAPFVASTAAPEAEAAEPEVTPALVAVPEARFVSNTEAVYSTVDRIRTDAESVQAATLDAPVALSITGADAAALTSLAGALVLGGAGSLIAARRRAVPVTVATGLVAQA